MANDSKNNDTEPTLGGKHSLSIRLWHWSTYLLITGSLVTVFMAKTILNPRANIPVVQNALQKNQITVSADVAKSVVHEFNDRMWDWHTFIGYVLAALFGFRILIEIFGVREQKLIPAIKNARRYLKQTSGNTTESKHYLFVKSLYVLFYISLGVQVCTGLFMAYSDDVPSLKKLRGTASDIHSFFMWVIIGYIVFHIAGVIKAEIGKGNKGIVSDMINGGE